MSSLIIVGAGGFAKEVAWLISDYNRQTQEHAYNLLGFVGDPSTNFRGRPSVLGNDDWVFSHLSPDIHYVIAIGNSMARKTLAQKYQTQHFSPKSLVHPSVHMSDSVQLGTGSIICAGSTLTTDIEIGQHVIINLHCTVGHDSRIEDFCTLSPGVHISGGVHIGQCCEIGTGAVILPGIKIGNNCRIGAGAVVTKELAAGKTYVGIPAREISS
ncbi:MAG: acetyltransferase [Bacteroidota bacterium]